MIMFDKFICMPFQESTILRAIDYIIGEILWEGQADREKDFRIWLTRSPGPETENENRWWKM